MLETQVEVDDMLEGPVHRLLHGGRSGQAAYLREEVVVDVNEPLGHERKYISSSSSWIYEAVAVLLALGCLLLHEDPASWRLDEYTFRSASDIVTVAESVWSLGAVTPALEGSFVWTAIE